MITERFAPSPTGLLHLGHAYSAALGWISARRSSGQFLLRIEDLDTSRCRAEFYGAIEEDLHWLGIHWDGSVLKQSDRLEAYSKAVDTLSNLGVVYHCTCSRKDLRNSVSAPQEGDVFNEPVLIYPGTCRDRQVNSGVPVALRLNIAAAIQKLGGAEYVSGLSFDSKDETGRVTQHSISASHLHDRIGDIVLKRKDGAYAYHLAVVVDDAFQNVTHVTRGEDLLEVTAIQRLLQGLLHLPTPSYHHHRLVRDDTGKRLAKRDDARSLQVLREQGLAPSDVFARLGLSDQIAEFAA